MTWFFAWVLPPYIIGFVFTVLIGSLMLFVPLSVTADGEALSKRRGARLIILSPVWPVMAAIGVKFLWSKAKATLKEDA